MPILLKLFFKMETEGTFFYKAIIILISKMHKEERKSPSNMLLEILANDHMYKTTTLDFQRNKREYILINQ